MVVQVLIAEKWKSPGGAKRSTLVEAFEHEGEARARFDELLEKGYDRVMRVPVNLL